MVSTYLVYSSVPLRIEPRCQNSVQEWSRVSTCEKTPGKQDKSLVTSISSKHAIVLGICFGTFGVAGKSEFTSDYSLKLAMMTSLKVSIEHGFCQVWLVCHMWLTLVTLTQVVLIYTQGIISQRLWIKLASAWDFHLPQLLAPSFQVQLFLEWWHQGLVQARQVFSTELL